MCSDLRDADLAVFKRFGIPPELLAEAGVRRVTDAEARNKYGIRGSGDMSGIVFPYFDPATMANRPRRWYARIRRDHPDTEGGKEKKKYVAPYGDHKHLYFPPTPELFADTSIPIVLVEAEKSALALTAWCHRNGRKLLPVAMGGCWGWRGRTGIRETATGERVPEHGALPDLNICRDGRRTYVLLDSNCGTNPKVQAARAALVRQLQRQGADVIVLDLPISPSVNGPDDYVAAYGDDAMARVFDEAGQGSKILEDVKAFIRRFVVLSDSQAIAIALWIAHTYAFAVAIYTPYLAVSSAVKRCGKSRLLETISYLVHRPWYTSGASAASLFREIEQNGPTLLLDETDALFKADKEMAQAIRGALNAGAHSKGVVSRIVGKGVAMTNRNFSVYCPKALAGIGNLPDTIADRSLHIRLERKLHTQKVERLRERTVGKSAGELRNRLAKWMEQRKTTIQNAEPTLPDELNDRQQDGAEILLGIADAAGGQWPGRGRKALVELYTGEAAMDDSLATTLLSDIKQIFERTHSEILSTKELLDHLLNFEHGIWKEYHQGKPLGSRSLAALLNEFGIGPRSTRRGKDTFKGYSRDMFPDAWQRYLDGIPADYPSQASQRSIYEAPTDFSDASQETPVTDDKNEENPVTTRSVTDVPAAKAPSLESHSNGNGAGCHVHPANIEDWWTRGDDLVCGRCHPNPKSLGV